MAIDKAVDSSFLDGGLNNIAAAIRDKTGKSDFLAFPNDFVTEISGITGGGGESVCKIGSFTPETDINTNSTPYTIQHDLGKIPKVFFMYVSQRDAWGSDSSSILFVYGIEIDAGGKKTVISTGLYSKDDSSDKFKNANIAYGAGYSTNNTLQSTGKPHSNNTMKVYGATEETINLMYILNGGKLKGGWTYTWIAL